MIVAKLSLPLSRHPSLSRHHWVGLVGATRGLVSLRSIEVLQVGARVAGARVAKLHGMRSRPMSRCNSTIYMPISTIARAKAPPPPKANSNTLCILQNHSWDELTSAWRAVHLSALHQVVKGPFYLYRTCQYWSLVTINNQVTSMKRGIRPADKPILSMRQRSRWSCDTADYAPPYFISQLDVPSNW